MWLYIPSKSVPAWACLARDYEPASPQPSTKRLNPAFGEWLMGWPVGWTIADPSASSASETALWSSALQQQLSCLFNE